MIVSNYQLQLSNIWHKYANNNSDWVLSSVNLKLKKGELVGLLGPSGCGKTTLLRLIAGFEKPSRGEIMIDNKVVADSNYILPPEKRGVGMVFQDYALFPHLNAWRNVSFGIKRHQDKSRAIWLLELLGLADLRYRYPHELSGGQCQRLALARALAPGTSLVVLDEPFSNLDVDVRHKLRSELSDVLSSCSATGLVVTHDPQEALAICDRIAVMREGSIHQCSCPTQLVNQPATPFVARFVLQRNVIPVEESYGMLITPFGLIKMPTQSISSKPSQIIVDENSLQINPHIQGKATILGREFHGDRWLLRVKQDNCILRISHTLEDPPNPGDKCFVDFRIGMNGILFPGAITLPLSC